MHTHNEDTLSLEPLCATARLTVSTSLGHDSTSLATIANVNNKANDLPSSPTSIYSFDSFIEESYVSPPISLKINVLDTAELPPRSYFSPDSAEFDEKWNEFSVEGNFDTSYRPYAPRNGSSASIRSGRSLSPSFRATASRITFKPVRAVRRSMRKSFSSQLSDRFAPSRGDAASGQNTSVGRPVVWRPYSAMLRLLNRSNSYMLVDEPHHPSITEATAHAMYSPNAEESSPARPPMIFPHNPYLGPSEKHVTCTAGNHKCRKSLSTPALKLSGRRTNWAAYLDSEMDACEEGYMDGIHDLTLEATAIALNLATKWKFEPFHQGEVPQKRRTSL